MSKVEDATVQKRLVDILNLKFMHISAALIQKKNLGRLGYAKERLEPSAA